VTLRTLHLLFLTTDVAVNIKKGRFPAQNADNAQALATIWTFHIIFLYFCPALRAPDVDRRVFPAEWAGVIFGEYEFRAIPARPLETRHIPR